MRRRVLIAAAVLMTVVSCGGKEAVRERALTQEEADRLASVMFMNHEKQGATFELTTSFTSTGDTLSMQGIIDWVNHRGRAVVSARGQEEGVAEVVWAQSVILERRPGLDAMLASTGHPGARYIARPPDPKNRQLDRAVAVLTGLASSVRDNGILILQKAGSAFMRTDTWRGKSVEVLRFGTQNRFWLEKGTDTLRRFDGNAAAGSAPIIIDFTEFGTRSIAPPPSAMVVAVDSVRDLYSSVTSG